MSQPTEDHEATRRGKVPFVPGFPVDDLLYQSAVRLLHLVATGASDVQITMELIVAQEWHFIRANDPEGYEKQCLEWASRRYQHQTETGDRHE